jgi:protein-S-isoprenylcysteine O-methyltransferase Ste14
MMLKKVMPPTYLLASMLLIILLHYFFPITTIVASPWNLLGLLPLVLGVLINIIADRDLKRAKTTVKPFQDSAALVTDGAYRISRHPMYLGFVLILAGISLLLGSASPFVVTILFAICMELLFIRNEEASLEEQFGQGWMQYKSRVRKWI